MKLTITNTAKKRIEEMIQASPEKTVFQLGLLKSGCTGFAYKMDLVESIGENEVEVLANGIKVAVAAADMEKLEGISLDWVQQGLSSRLAINNPNVKNTCGCGESIGF